MDLNSKIDLNSGCCWAFCLQPILSINRHTLFVLV